MPRSRTHIMVVALDGMDDGARDRRLAARPRHFTRVRAFAEKGVLTFGGAILDKACHDLCLRWPASRRGAISVRKTNDTDGVFRLHVVKHRIM
jgi:hypothetical protein